MRVRAFVLSLLCALLMALPAVSQGVPTGTLSGRVTTADGEALPGVLVTASSPSLQGTRTTTTSENGDYTIPFLPPGPYRISFELEGFLSPQQDVKISAAQNTQLDADMTTSTVSEEIMVTGTYETISTTTQAASTYEKTLVESLPVEREIRESVLLTPGVTDTGPGGDPRRRGISIAGALSYESLFLVNGVVINENLRGQPLSLFIEDALEETTTSVSGISAEYGRFGGGVVNVLTKSGSNEMHGSFRTALTNEDWEAATPETIEQADKVNQRYEATLGGYLWKDKVWYFLAGRDFKDEQKFQTFLTNIPFDHVDDEQRYEGKLTLAPFTGHRLIGSYIKIDAEELGNRFQPEILDLASLVNRQLPQELMAVNYTGVITDSFFVEGQYSQREFTFKNSGSIYTDLIKGTLLIDTQNGNRWWSPTFCGVCRDEERDNENILAKGSWFLSSQSMGSHDVAFGYDQFTDIRVADNHQSGSDYRVVISSTIMRNGQLFPRLISGNNATFLQWNPIDVASQGTDFVTNSYFLNDKWRLNNHLSFNLGVRYDANDGANAAGQKVADDSRISPRLGLAYDPKGDGDWVFSANYGHYVASIANNQGDASSAGGNPAAFQFTYRGPDINLDPNAANLVTTEDALRTIFNWYNNGGGVQANVRFINLPGVTTVIEGSLESPYTEEYSVGASKRLGRRGVIRSDYVHRQAKSFYSLRTDLSTGSVRVNTSVGPFTGNKTVLENSDDGIEREYDGLHSQFQVRPTDRLSVGGTWTWSHLRGNFDGETAANGPVAAATYQFPEYKDASWNNPSGDLSTDQRHRVRFWGVYDILRNDHHKLSASLLQNYYSGVPYGAVGNVDPKLRAALPNGVPNPGYTVGPANVVYYFTTRDAFHTDTITATDLSLNYSFHWATFGKDVEIFLQPELLNAFNENGQLRVDASILSATNDASLKPFNPLTDTPVEGVHWKKGANFGKVPAGAENFYQQPRTYRMSVGLRF